MSKIQASGGIAQVKPEDVPRFVDIFCQEVLRVVNGGLDFSTNFDCKIVSATFTVANSDLAVAHGLGRVAGGYFPINKSAAMDIYTGSGQGTASTIYLRSSAVGAVDLVVF